VCVKASMQRPGFSLTFPIFMLASPGRSRDVSIKVNEHKTSYHCASLIPLYPHLSPPLLQNTGRSKLNPKCYLCFDGISSPETGAHDDHASTSPPRPADNGSLKFVAYLGSSSQRSLEYNKPDVAFDTPPIMPGILPMKVIKVGASAQSRIAQACDR